MALKPVITARKDRRARTTHYQADLGPVTVSELDRATAGERCEAEVRAALERLERGPQIGQWRGHTYVIAPDVAGWCYWTSAFSSSNVRNSQRGSREDVENAALRHLAQITWTHDVEDDTAYVEGLPFSIRAGLVSYFAWQRTYKAARDAGHDDEQARQLAEGR